MSVRNCAEIGENAQKIINRLLNNQDLIKLLYYNDKDPLSNPDLTKEQIKNEVYNKLIKVIPRIGPTEYAKSMIAMIISDGMPNENNEFEDIIIQFEIFVPMTQWIIKDTNLRPFKIMGELQKSLVGKSINGLGKIHGGSFSFNYSTDETSCYKQIFRITTYD